MLKSVGSNWARTLVNFGVVFALTPFLIDTLGKDGNGVWGLVNSTAGLLSLLVLGVPMASVRFFSEHAARRDLPALNRAVGSCFGLYLLLGAAAVVLGAGLFLFYELAYSEQIPVTWVAEGRWAFGLVVLFVASGFAAQLPYGIMVAHHDFALSNLLMIAGLLLRLVLTLVLLSLVPSLSLLACVHLLVLALEFLGAWVLARRRYPGVRISLANFDRAGVRQIFTFSLYVLLLNIGYRLAFQADAMVIGAFRPVEDITFYNVGNNFMIYLAEVVIAIGQVVMPTATRLQTLGRQSELRDVFLKWSKIAASLVLLGSCYLLVLGPEFMVWWQDDPSFAGPSGEVLRILTVSFVIFLPVRGVALPLLLGLGKAAQPAWGLLGMGLLNLGISLVLVHPLGLAGVALGTAIPNVLYAAWVLRLACRELGVPLGHYLRYVAGRPLVGSLPILGFLLALKSAGGVEGFWPLLLAGLGMLLLFVAVWTLFVYRGDPLLDLRARVQAFWSAWRRGPPEGRR